MKTTREVYNEIMKETKDVPENLPYLLTRVYMRRYAQEIINKCMEISNEVPIEDQYQAIKELKNQLK